MTNRSTSLDRQLRLSDNNALKKFKKIVRRMLIAILVLVVVLVAAAALYLQHPQFGKAPSGERLVRMEKSEHFRKGTFHNLSETPSLAEGYTMGGIFWDFLFTKFPKTIPVDKIPSVITDLNVLDPTGDVLIWFGHSSYFFRLDGTSYLVDPVFSGNASPISGTTKAFPGSNGYSVADMPHIDYLLITHDHYDHLDYKTIKSLRPKVGEVITSLGVGSHLEFWGYTPDQITELDWNESTILSETTTIHAVPARHFSGRTLKRNTTLWSAFVLETRSFKLFVGGDSGYDDHFKEIGRNHGPFDLAILENGQYNLKWHYIHLLPEEGVRAARELGAKKLFPVHNSKFKLAEHPWKEPMERITAEAEIQGLPIITPKIGEKVDLGGSDQLFQKWWVGLE